MAPLPGGFRGSLQLWELPLPPAHLGPDFPPPLPGSHTAPRTAAATSAGRGQPRPASASSLAPHPRPPLIYTPPEHPQALLFQCHITGESRPPGREGASPVTLQSKPRWPHKLPLTQRPVWRLSQFPGCPPTQHVEAIIPQSTETEGQSGPVTVGRGGARTWTRSACPQGQDNETLLLLRTPSPPGREKMREDREGVTPLLRGATDYLLRYLGRKETAACHLPHSVQRF